MKQNLNLFFAIAILVMAAHSCTKSGDTVDDDDTVTESQQSPSVGELVNIQIGAFESTTKVSYDPNDDKSVYAFSWEAGEMISVVVPDTDYNENQKFTAVTSEVSTIFNGQIGTWTDQKTLYAISPYSEEGYTIDSTNQTFFYDNSSQTIDASTTDYYSNSLMVSAVDNATVVSSTEYNIPDLKFSQVMSFFELELTNIPSDERCTTVGFETDLDLFVASANINLTDGSINPLTYSNRVSIDINNQNGTEATFNIALLPADLSNVPITLFVTTANDTNNKKYTYEINNGINFTSNTFFSSEKGSLSLTGSSDFSESSSSLSLADFDNEFIPTTDTWVIIDTEATEDAFNGLKSVLSSVYSTDNASRISIEFPYLNAIPSNAFYSISALSSISAPKALSIGLHAFFSCSSLESVDLPLVNSINDSVFADCSSLKNIEFSLVTSIPAYAFSNCSSLEQVNLPLVNTLHEYAFEHCSSLKTITLQNITSIPKYSFSYCSLLQSIDSPLVHDIWDYAFEGCSSLASVYFPSLTYIGYGGFSTCSSLESVNFPLVTSTSHYAFSNCSSLKRADLPSLKSINFTAFQYCSLLESVDSPLASSIGRSAFYGCSSLESVNFPIATSIDSGTFAECSSLESVYFPMVTSIGSSSFADCILLESVDFPAITTIGGYAFSGCDALQSMSLATDKDVILSVIGSFAFLASDDSTNEENITLTLGLWNSVNIDSNTLTVKVGSSTWDSSISYTFNKIILSEGPQLNFEATANDGVGAKW